LPDLAAIADEIERRLDGAGDDTPPEHREPA
jgi:hypothetical protein